MTEPPVRRAFMTHVVSLAATKTADGLMDPKLVLPWLAAAAGVPVAFVGAFVPIREAGSMLPQLAVAARLERRRRRAPAWAFGSAVQGLAVLGMVAAILRLDGVAAGWALVAALAAFAIARCITSVSTRDLMARTLRRGTRGRASGLSASIAAGLVLAWGVLLATGVGTETRVDGAVESRAVMVVLGGLMLAAILWFAAAIVFSTLPEPDAEPADRTSGTLIADAIRLLREDRQLARFTAARACLAATALAPPWLVAATALGPAATGDGMTGPPSPGVLGPFIVASGLAATFGGVVWGWLSDRSSRRTLVMAGGVGTIAILAAAVSVSVGSHVYAAAGLLLVMSIAYQGVRIGRSTHIVDMAPKASAARYAATSNTVVSLAILAGGGLGAIAATAGTAWVLGVCAACTAAGTWLAVGLAEVQRPSDDSAA